jgi:hypothetical protein
MNKSHLMILLATIVAGATACSGSPDSAGGSPTSRTSSAESTFDHHQRHECAIVPQLKVNTPTIRQTVPDNGDLNPYGVAFVPRGFPAGPFIQPGDILVANFNNNVPPSGLQGTGTTLVRTTPPGNAPDVFFSSANLSGNVMGLSTALGVLRRGFVIVGNVPSTPSPTSTCLGPPPAPPTLGQCCVLQDDVGQGQLTVLDNQGRVVAVLSDLPYVNGPWDLTLDDLGDRARLYVSNVKSGTVSRIDLRVGWDTVEVKSQKTIASGYSVACNPAAFVAGPTGLARDEKRDLLYVASTMDNAIYVVKDASDRRTDGGTGRVVVAGPPPPSNDPHLRGPLGLVRAANGNLISAQGDAFNADPNFPSEIVEFTKNGKFVDQISVDPAQGGAFGIALEQKRDDPGKFRFAAVDDNVPDLLVWDVKSRSCGDDNDDE